MIPTTCMSNQRRPSGPKWPVTPEWRAHVLEVMAARGVSKAELSRRIGVSDAAITLLLPERAGARVPKSSALVPAIHRVLGIAVPVAPQISTEIDAVRAELDAAWPSLSEDDRRMLLDVARRLSAARSKT